MNTFQDLGLNEDLLQAITDMGFTKPSEVQDKAIPILLEKESEFKLSNRQPMFAF
mgnify:CR=1 FL=1